MSTASRASDLLTTLASDPALRQRLSATPQDQRAAIIAELGFADVSSAEVIALAESLTPHVNEDSSIDDEELEAVTGGAGFEPPIYSAGSFIVY